MAMNLEAGERLVLKTLLDLQGDLNENVDDARIAGTAKMLVKDVRDWLETLEGKGFIERIRQTAGFTTYITAKGRLALKLVEPIPFTMGSSVDSIMEDLHTLDELVLSEERSHFGPAVAMFEAEIYVGWTGTDSHLNVVTGQFKTILGERSAFGPAIAEFGGRLYLAWTGTDEQRHLNVMSSSDGVHFRNKITLGETSSGRPAIAEFGGRLYLAWTGTDEQRHLNLISSSDGVSFSNKVTLSESASAGPAIAEFGGRLYLAWTGTDEQRHLKLISSSNGREFCDRIALDESTSGGPGLCKFLSDTHKREALAVCWFGTDDQRTGCILVSLDGTCFSDKQSFYSCQGSDSPGIMAAKKSMSHGRKIWESSLFAVWARQGNDPFLRYEYLLV